MRNTPASQFLKYRQQFSCNLVTSRSKTQATQCFKQTLSYSAQESISTQKITWSLEREVLTFFYALQQEELILKDIQGYGRNAF